MHRTYEATNAPVRVSWFNDRIEVLSPGGAYGHGQPLQISAYLDSQIIATRIWREQCEPSDMFSVSVWEYPTAPKTVERKQDIQPRNLKFMILTCR